MTFTDSDVKRLKEIADIYETTPGTVVIAPQMTVDQLRALLARLEAAEKICNFFEETHPTQGDPMFDAWRKSCGK